MSEGLVVSCSSCKRAAICTTSGEYPSDLTISEASSIVDEGGNDEPEREKYRENNKGKDDILRR